MRKVASPRRWASTSSSTFLIWQVGFDQFVHHPLMYFPVFYVLKELVNGGEPIAGLQKYRQVLGKLP